MRRISCAVLLAVACATSLRAAHATPASGIDPATRLDAISRIAGVHLEDRERTEWMRRIRSAGDAALTRFIERIVGDEGFIARTGPTLLLGDYAEFQNISPKVFILNKTERDGKTIWSRDERPPCELEDAVSVQPWWRSGRVLICPQDYRPGVRRSNEGTQCSAMNKTSGCGCGPNLMRCGPPEAAAALAQAQTAEVRDTAAYLIRKRRPIRDLFLTTETMRDAYAEFLYRRWRVEQAALAEPGVIGEPKPASWQPRVELMKGQHAGVLTTQNVVYWESGLRPVMRVLYEMLWCSEPSSTGVTAAAVLDLGAADVRAGEGWQNLARRPICTECHARLDYGMQFFWGFMDARKGVYFDPTRARVGEGELFGNNIDDPRGRAELTPQGFARLVVAQPEFSTCQVKKIVQRVFGAHADPDDYAAVRAEMDLHGDLVSMMSAALRRYATRPVVAPSPARLAADGAHAGQQVTLPPALADEIEARCATCHSKNEPRLDSPTLPVATVAKMAVAVAFGKMPKRGLLEDAARRSLAERLFAAVPHRASDDVDRYYAGYPAMRARAEGAIVDDLRAELGLPAQATPARVWGRIPDDVNALTPGLIATVAADAIEACDEQRSMAREACIQHVLRFDQLRLIPAP